MQTFQYPDEKPKSSLSSVNIYHKILFNFSFHGANRLTKVAQHNIIYET